MKRPVRTPSPFDEAAPLSPFIIRKIARRKGLVVDGVMKGKGGRRLIVLADAKTGSAIAFPNRMSGLSLYEAKRYLDQLPDRIPTARPVARPTAGRS
jgi:hypothetical protein